MKDVRVEERWVGAEEVAAHLGVAKESVYRWVESRGLPVHRLGRLFRFRLSEVDAWVADPGRTRATVPPAGRRVAEPRAEYGAAPIAPARAKWPPTSDEVRAAIDEMVRIIVDEFHPEKIILFGSHARADAGPDSDVDLLVIMEVAGSKAELEIEIGVSVDDVLVPKDIVVATPAEIQKYRGVIGTLVGFALREGRTLYERPG